MWQVFLPLHSKTTRTENMEAKKAIIQVRTAEKPLYWPISTCPYTVYREASHSSSAFFFLVPLSQVAKIKGRRKALRERERRGERYIHNFQTNPAENLLEHQELFCLPFNLVFQMPGQSIIFCSQEKSWHFPRGP